jgi:hypothetical protein
VGGFEGASCGFTNESSSTPEKASDTARRKLGEVGNAAREQAQKLADQATGVMESARHQGKEALQQQKSKASEQVSRYSSVVRGVADKFREEQNTSIAGYADGMADQLDRLAGYLSWRDFNGLFDDAQDAARRRPDVFFGSMFVAGLALSRFLKASRPERRTSAIADEPSGNEFAVANVGQWQRTEVDEQSRSFDDPGVAEPIIGPEEPTVSTGGFCSTPSPYGS